MRAYKAYTSYNQYWDRKYFNQFSLGYDDESVFKQIIKRISPFTMVGHEGLFTLADFVRFCETGGPQGAYVETGCNRGGSCAMMAAINLQYGSHRRDIHAFDSFQGLPEPIAGKDNPDQTMHWFGQPDYPAHGRLIPTGIMIASQDEVKRVVLDICGYDPDRLFVHPGWFQDTVPSAAREIGPIAVLRLDGDLYDSTRVCLEYLYPLVVPGGLVYIDDWCYDGCRKACEEYLQSIGLRPYLHVADHCARYWIKP